MNATKVWFCALRWGLRLFYSGFDTSDDQVSHQPDDIHVFGGERKCCPVPSITITQLVAVTTSQSSFLPTHTNHTPATPAIVSCVCQSHTTPYNIYCWCRIHLRYLVEYSRRDGMPFFTAALRGGTTLKMRIPVCDTLPVECHRPSCSTGSDNEGYILGLHHHLSSLHAKCL